MTRNSAFYSERRKWHLLFAWPQGRGCWRLYLFNPKTWELIAHHHFPKRFCFYLPSQPGWLLFASETPQSLLPALDICCMQILMLQNPSSFDQKALPLDLLLVIWIEMCIISEHEKTYGVCHIGRMRIATKEGWGSGCDQKMPNTTEHMDFTKLSIPLSTFFSAKSLWVLCFITKSSS